MKKMEFDVTSLSELSYSETALIQGGDVDGLMRGKGADIAWMGDVYDFAVSFGAGLLKGFFS